jgi:PAS domain-containing protein
VVDATLAWSLLAGVWNPKVFAPQLIAVFVPNWERLYINRIALDYLAIGLDGSSEDVHPDDASQLEAAMRHALSSQSSFEIEVRLRKEDNSFRWFLVRFSPVHSPGRPNRSRPRVA